MRKNRFLSFMLVLGMLAQTFALDVMAETNVTYYVKTTGNDAASGVTLRAAFKTIGKAKDAAQVAIAEGKNVVIEISEGTYYLPERLKFSSDAMGYSEGSLTIKPYNNGNVTISGGEKLDNTKFEVYNHAQKIYKIPYPTDPLQMYVDGSPVIRSRTTETQLPFTVLKNSDGSQATAITTTNTDVANWDLSYAEIVTVQAFDSPRTKINSVSVSNGVATFNVPNFYKFNNNYTLSKRNSKVLFLENTIEGLDEDGEWCYDGEFIYYKLRDKEDILSSEFVVPKAYNDNDIWQAPITFEGKADKPVRNITVSGIEFSHGEYRYRVYNSDYFNMQCNSFLDLPEIPGLINTTYAHNIKFENCVFSNTGGSGLGLHIGSKNVTITGCEFSEISSVPILIGSVKGERNGEIEENIVENISIENSKIHDGSTEYRAGAAIQVGYSRDIRLIHNEVYNFPYTAFHIGYGWNYHPSSVVGGIEVKYNYIHDCMTELDDGGGIYVLGATNAERGLRGERNEIAYNYIKDSIGEGGYLYQDSGSNYWNIHHNVLDFTDNSTQSVAWTTTSTTSSEIYIRNNYTNNSYETSFDEIGYWRSSDLKDTNIVFEKNADGSPVYNSEEIATAKAIMTNAGCSDKYLYSFDDFDSTMTSENTTYIDNGAIIKAGGNVSLNYDLAGKALNFTAYAGNRPDGTIEIEIDDIYSIKLTKNNATIYENGQTLQSANAICLLADKITDIMLTLAEGKIRLDCEHEKVFEVEASALTNGRVTLSVAGMNVALGSLALHEDDYVELLKLFGESINSNNLLTNGYFEKNADGWIANGVRLVQNRRQTYDQTSGSMQITETSANGYAYQNVTLEGGKWYRISAMVKMSDSTVSKTAFARFTSSAVSKSVTTWGCDYVLNSGWNKVKDYIMVDSETTVALALEVGRISGTDMMYTYYVDNFEVVAENPQLTESGFENGSGVWDVYAGRSNENMQITDRGYTGNGLLFENIPRDGIKYAEGYTHLIRKIHLMPGKRYKARAKVYVQRAATVDESDRITEIDKVTVVFGTHDNQAVTYPYDSLNGYQEKVVKVGEWANFEFEFVNKTNVENAPNYLKILTGGRAVLVVDDVEIVEVDGYKIRTGNTDFTDRMNDWEYDGVADLSFEAGEGVRIVPETDSCRVYRELYVLNDTEYYAEALMKLYNANYDDYTLGNVKVELLEDAMIESEDFAIDDNYAESKKLLNDEQWTKVGGKIKFILPDGKKGLIHIRVSADVRTSNGKCAEYGLDNFRMMPLSDFSTSLSDAKIIADGKVEHNATGTGDVRYKYYTYNNGWTLSDSGVIAIGEALPDIGEGVTYALLTTVNKNGADERIETLESAEIRLLDAVKSDNGITVKTAGVKNKEDTYIIGVYSDDEKILEECVFSMDSYHNIDIALDGNADNITVKAFIWDLSLMLPKCEALDITVN